MKSISKEGLALIKQFEGCRLTAYDDLQPNKKLTVNTKLKGTLTIGYGHTKDVRIGQTITQQQADDLLLTDLKVYESYVNNIAFVPFTAKLNQYQFDALTSFCYNCGPNNLKRLCYNSSISEIPQNIVKYNKASGHVLGGLVRRRYAEQQLFLKEVNTMNENEKIENELLSLRKEIVELKRTVKMLVEKTEEHEAPAWFNYEFPDKKDILQNPKGTRDFWRSFAVTLRLLKK